MHVQLTDQEREILMRLVQRELSDLGSEIRHTDAADYRDELRAYKQILSKLSLHLSASPIQ